MQSKSDTLKLIKTIAKSGKKLAIDIQTATVAAIFYSVNSGDVTIGQKLMESLNTGVKSNNVQAMLCHYGQFAKSGKSVKYEAKEELQALYLNADGTDTASDEAAEAYVASITTQWTSFKVEKQPEVVDCLAVLQAALAKCSKAMAVGGVGAMNQEAYTALSNAMTEFVGEDEEALPKFDLDITLVALMAQDDRDEIYKKIGKALGYEFEEETPAVEQQQKAA